MKLLIAGDFCPNHRVAELFEQRCYSDVLGDINKFTSEADFSIVNLECPVADHQDKRIRKCGPNLRCSETGVEALRWAGFNCVTLANNHIMDYGASGLDKTINCCRKNGLNYVGAGNNIESASRILYIEDKGKVVSIINCCEHEFNIATSEKPGANPLNVINQFYLINEAKNKSDYVVVIIHGGHEHYQLPSTRMQEAYRFFIDSGADVVVNHHQHCYSGYEVYKGHLIFYGLGNFCFDWKSKRPNTWYQGYLLQLELDINGIAYKLHPYIQCKAEPRIVFQDYCTIKDTINSLNQILNNNKLLKQKENDYYSHSCLEMNLVLEPITNRIIQALQIRKLLPKYYFSRKYLLRLYNFVMCESHRDKLSFFLESHI